MLSRNITIILPDSLDELGDFVSIYNCEISRFDDTTTVNITFWFNFGNDEKVISVIDGYYCKSSGKLKFFNFGTKDIKVRSFNNNGKK